jgi:hypothetical protein
LPVERVAPVARCGRIDICPVGLRRGGQSGRKHHRETRGPTGQVRPQPHRRTPGIKNTLQPAKISPPARPG